MRVNRLGALLLGLSIYIGACSPAEDPVVAEYHGEKLSRNEVMHFIPPQTDAKDSARAAQLYIDEWLRAQVLVRAAHDSLPDVEERVKYKVTDYHRKLLMVELLERVAQARLDTVVTDEELEKFYEQRQGDYLFTSPYYQYFYLSCALQDVFPRLQALLTSPNPADHAALVAWAKQHCKEYSLDSTWREASALNRLQSFTAVALRGLKPRQAPVQFPSADKPRTDVYYFYMLNVIVPGQPLPLAIVAPKVRVAMLNQRRHKLMAQYETQMLQDAYANNDIKVH